MSTDFLPPPPPPPRKTVGAIVDPAALARVYAGSLLASATAYGTAMVATSHRIAARDAVLDFVKLMRETYEG